MFISQYIVYSALLISPFLIGVTVDDYGNMVVDLAKTRAVIEQVIPADTPANTARIEKIMAQIGEISKAVNEYNASFKGSRNEIVHLYADYGSKPEDFQKALARLDVEREKGLNRILDACFKMKGVMTPQEWKAVFKTNPKG